MKLPEPLQEKIPPNDNFFLQLSIKKEKYWG